MILTFVVVLGPHVLVWIFLLQKKIAKKVTLFFAVAILDLMLGLFIAFIFLIKRIYQISVPNVLIFLSGSLLVLLSIEVWVRVSSNIKTLGMDQTEIKPGKFLDKYSMQRYGPDFLAEEHLYKQGLLLEAKKFKRIVSLDNYLSQISVRNGFRVTCDQPDYPTYKLLLLGGSTIFNAQVPNTNTIASILQSMMNTKGMNCQVVNVGVSGATSSDRMNFVMETKLAGYGDIVVLYFGINDALVQTQLNPNANPMHLLVHLLNVCIDLGKKYMQTLAKVRLFKAPMSAWRVRRYVQRTSIPEIKNFEQYCKDLGVRFLAILQPSLFFEPRLGADEIDYVNSFSDYVQKLLAVGNKLFSAELGKEIFFMDGRELFNNVNEPVYADCFHTTAYGNFILSEYILSQITELGLTGER